MPNAILLASVVLLSSLRAAEYPQAEISNGQIRAALNLMMPNYMKEVADAMSRIIADLT